MLDEWAALEGKVAVVTGGAGGLGLPISEDLARAGMPIAICDRDSTAVADVSERLARMGAPALVECFDVRDSARLQDFFEQVDEQFGPVDVLVNVPGGSYRQPSMDLTAHGVEAVIRQNFTHVLESSQLAARRMRAHGRGGSIITVSTVEAHRAMPNMAVYGAMKAGVEQLTRTLAVEWGPLGIRVNTVAPDHFPTADSNDPAWVTALGDRIVIPLARKGVRRDLSGCVLFLASDLASYVTGTTLHIDGGTLAAAGWMLWPTGFANMVPTSVVESLGDPSAKQ